MFMTVATAISRRTGPTCRMAGCISGANMNTIPASRRAAAIRSTGASMRTPRASRTSALPHWDVNDRFPCLATRTPAPPASNAAAVEMLNVRIVPPPVPHVSTSSSGRSAGNGTITCRIARTTAATSAGVSPLTRRPTRSAPICAGVASPAITMSNADVSSVGASGSPAVRRRMVVSSGLGAVGALPDTERFHQTFRQPRVRRDERDDEAEQPHAVDVLLHEHAVLRAVGEIDDAHELFVVHQRKADERARREVLVVQQRVLVGFSDVAHEERLARGGHATRHAVADRDAGSFSDAGRKTARGGDVE